MLRVDEGRDSAQPLRVRNDGQRQRGVSAGLRAIDLGDSAARYSADADRRVQIDRTGWNGLDPDLILGAEPHDRTFAAALLDLRYRQVQCLLLVVGNRRNSHSSPPFG